VFGRDYLPIDDALYAALRVLEIVAGAPGPLSARLADLPPRVSTAEIKVRCPDEAKFRVVEAVRAELESRFPVVAVDGARVRFPDGWGLVRASNTTPVLTVRLEARDAPALERIRAELRRALARHGEVTIGDLDAGRDSHAS
jgi:phosphomannomutase/phosphoglucomutase